MDTEQVQSSKAKEDAPMEFHKPKPIHIWHEFLKEYAIIVIGVLTALAAEQAVAQTEITPAAAPPKKSPAFCWNGPPGPAAPWSAWR